MSIAASIGAQSLIQLGVSLSDIALLISQGRKFGNWFTTRRNDEDLFECLMEDPEALLKRRGLVSVVRMQALFPHVEFLYHGQKISSEQKKLKVEEKKELGTFSWFMVVIVSVLDLCLPKSEIMELVINVFTQVLQNPEAESSLRVSLDVNIESWASFGRVRKVAASVRYAFRKAWHEKTQTSAVPQLNQAETEEMSRFISELLCGETSDFVCVSATTFAAARAIQQAGIYINVTETKRSFPNSFSVSYASDQTVLSDIQTRHHPDQYDDPLRFRKGLISRAQMISYPARNPESMVHACKTSQSTINRMKKFWHYGTRAADKFQLHARAELPFHPEDEFYYEISGDDVEVDSFDAMTSIVAGKAFPCSSQSILAAVRELIEGHSEHRKEWLATHVGKEFLMRHTSTLPNFQKGDMDLWLCYQALIFGFYYKLLESLVTLDFLSEEDAYFQGLWGYGSTTFLAMCTQFGDELRLERKVGRSHVLYMLATMYAGRPRVYSKKSRKGLVGVLGQTSIIALPLLRTTDVPQELAKYAVTDLSVAHLVSEDDELYAATGLGIVFDHISTPAKAVQPRGPSREWSIHSTMRQAFRDGGPGVVMVARCRGRLVGWFNPSAADTVFLSTAYQYKRHDEEDIPTEATEVVAVEILDQHWEEGRIWRPLPEEDPRCTFGVVQSAGCPVLRYAAAGFYAESGEEVAIANGDISAAFGRVEALDSGIIIC